MVMIARSALEDVYLDAGRFLDNAFCLPLYDYSRLMVYARRGSHRHGVRGTERLVLRDVANLGILPNGTEVRL